MLIVRWNLHFSVLKLQTVRKLLQYGGVKKASLISMPMNFSRLSVLISNRQAPKKQTRSPKACACLKAAWISRSSLNSAISNRQQYITTWRPVLNRVKSTWRMWSTSASRTFAWYRRPSLPIVTTSPDCGLYMMRWMACSTTRCCAVYGHRWQLYSRITNNVTTEAQRHRGLFVGAASAANSPCSRLKSLLRIHNKISAPQRLCGS